MRTSSTSSRLAALVLVQSSFRSHSVLSSRARDGEVQEEDLPIPYLTDDAEELGPCPAGEQHTQRKT